MTSFERDAATLFTRLPKAAPLIGISACVKDIDHLPFHAVGEKYLTAIVETAGGLPLAIPALGPKFDLSCLVERLDGLLLTGSLSNVEPHHYQGPKEGQPETRPDPARDATTLPLIQEALRAGLPLFCICRGIQELNVALGGTLNPQIHLLPGNMDHRAVQNAPLDIKYGPRHKVILTPGGILETLLGEREISVNSLHWQAIDRLADDLQIEGRAEDGVIEAVSVKEARNFALGLQWHPEYRAADNPVSRRLFGAFGDAARSRAASRALISAAGSRK